MNCKISLALLRLLVNGVVLSMATDIASSMELRCQCVSRMSDFIPIRQIARIELILDGPHCPRVEVIATLKQGMLTCLDPDAEWVKLIIHRMLNSAYMKETGVFDHTLDHVNGNAAGPEELHATETAQNRRSAAGSIGHYHMDEDSAPRNWQPRLFSLPCISVEIFCGFLVCLYISLIS